ncbi:MAG: type II toxin-antitoxin system VapC family toxin [Chitinispirillaceae bacterium]|nr:type II toxin-antitoxin system VapC family toxin [Chitinispirillaceae bacterium]
MKKKMIVDTDVVIDFLRGEKKAVSYFKSMSEFICFSSITVAEIYSGTKNQKEEDDIDRLFSIFPQVSVTNEVARLAGKLVNHYRPSHGIEIPDAIIAATCMILEANLSTLNVKHYPMFDGLKPPYKK